MAVKDFIEAAVKAVREDRRLQIALAGAAAVVVGKLLFGARDGSRHMTPQQLPFAEPKSVTADGCTFTVQRVLPAEVDSAADTLAAGLANDAMMAACGYEKFTPKEREQALRWVCRVLLRSVVPSSYGAICLQTASKSTVAVWFPNGRDVSASALLLNGAWQYTARFTGWARRGRLQLYVEAVQPRRHRIVAQHGGSFYYLLSSGSSRVEESVRQAELKAVLTPVLAQADAEGVPCYLEHASNSSSSEAAEDTEAGAGSAAASAAASPDASAGTLAVYESLGFAGVDEFTLFGVRVVIMRRDASKG